MEYIQPRAWQHSLGVNRAAKVFVACFREVTHPFTIDVYRARYLNVRLAFAELTETIHAVQEKKIDPINIRDLAAETKRLLEEDILIPGLIPNRQFLYQALIAPFIDAKETQVHPSLEIISRGLLDKLHDTYAEALVRELRRSIERDEPESTKVLAGTLATDLLGRGYDIRHLHSIANTFLTPPIVPFPEKLECFLRQFDPQATRTFRVIFRLIFHRPMNPFPGSIGGISLHRVLAEPALNPHEAGFLRERPTWRYVAIDDVEALDPFSAVKKALAAVALRLDLLQLAEPAAQVSTYGTALVLEAAQPHLVSLTNRVLGPPRLARDWLAALEARFQVIQSAAHVAEQARVRISSGLRYLRMGLTDDTTEGQFLNLWIGLESLFARPGRSPIEAIRHCLPSFLTYRHPASLLLDLRENIIRCHALPEEPLRSNLTRLADKVQQLVHLWLALRDPDLRAHLLVPASDHPLLHTRILETASTLESSERVRHAIMRHKTDVTWHLQRMYRVRNRIVHEGAAIPDLTLLSGNLAAYLWTSLDELLSQLSRHNALRTIEEVVSKVDSTFTRIEETLKADPHNATPLADLIDPDRIWP